MAHPQQRINTIPHGSPQAKQPTEQWCTKIMQNIFLSYHCPKSKLKIDAALPHPTIRLHGLNVAVPRAAARPLIQSSQLMYQICHPSLEPNYAASERNVDFAIRTDRSND